MHINAFARMILSVNNVKYHTTVAQDVIQMLHASKEIVYVCLVLLGMEKFVKLPQDVTLIHVKMEVHVAIRTSDMHVHVPGVLLDINAKK